MIGEEGFKQFYKTNLKLSEPEYQRFLGSVNTPLPRTFRMLNYRGDVETALVPLLLDAGFIYSQEVVSTLPVRLMQLTPEHIVLDMCAAPGSKSTQIVQNVRLLVANEVSAKRCNVLVSNLKKTPSASIVVTSQDACSFPLIRLPADAGEPSPLYFDRILCDVPCSSDGTVRKDRKILERWQVNTSLFTLQVKILKRAAKLLKRDGLIVYSTCTFSPIENEAVVQKFCSECAFEVVDCTKIFDLDVKRVGPSGCYEDQQSAGCAEILPNDIYKITGDPLVSKVPQQFVFREGLKDWNPFVERTNDTQALFATSSAELRNCLRVMPHDQDTGGFFIAVLRRKPTGDDGGARSMACRLEPSAASGDASACGAATADGPETCENSRQKFEAVDDTLASYIKDYYGLKGAEVLVTESRVIRCVDRLAFLVAKCPRLKVVSVGVRAFEKNNFSVEKTSSYRISYEYTQLVWKQLERVVHVGKDEFKAMMEEFCPITTHIEGCVVFECEGFVCPGFVNNGKGMFFMNKQVKEVMRRIL